MARSPCHGQTSGAGPLGIREWRGRTWKWPVWYIYIYIYSTHRYTNLFITVTYIHFISFRERNAKKEPVLLEDSEYIYRSKCVEIKCLKSSPSLPPSLALAILQWPVKMAVCFTQQRRDLVAAIFADLSEDLSIIYCQTVKSTTWTTRE